MKQLDFFSDESRAHSSSHSSEKEPSHWKLFIDGASRNNPGPAGAGFYLLKDSEAYLKKGFYLGIKTNNQAEYLALLLGLCFVMRDFQPGDTLHIISDSQLLVRQVEGAYRVKSPELKPLFAMGKCLVQELGAEIFHVLRTDNVQADAMANEGIDRKVPVPAFCKTMLASHGLSI